MTAKEKAKELVNKMYSINKYEFISIYASKGAALIAVDLLIKSTPSVNIYPPNCQQITPKVREYWIRVKQEIEKL